MQQIGHGQTGAHHSGDSAVMIGECGRDAPRNRSLTPPAQCLNQQTRFDADGARRRAESARGAGIDPMIVVEIAKYSDLWAAWRFAPEARDFPPADDTLPRRQRESVRRTLRLAKSTLDALVDERVALRQRLQILEMRDGIVVDDDTGIQQSLRVKQGLDLSH